jgi:hypothetical protein
MFSEILGCEAQEVLCSEMTREQMKNNMSAKCLNDDHSVSTVAKGSLIAATSDVRMARALGQHQEAAKWAVR